KDVSVGLRWKKRRGQDSVTSETSSGEEEQRQVRGRRSFHVTPDSVSRILTRLDKQNSIEDTTSTSGSNSSSHSTPDHRPLRRNPRNSNRVQSFLDTKVDVDCLGSSGTDSNISKLHKSDTNYSGSNKTSSSSTSTSSSSTPEPELPTRPPSRRVAALRHKKLLGQKLRSGKRGKSRGLSWNQQKWRGSVPSPAASSELRRSPKIKNNDENVDHSNREDGGNKTQKRKYNSTSKLSEKLNSVNSSLDILEKKDHLVEKISQHFPNKKPQRATTIVSDSESADDPIVVVYEKTNFKPRTPLARSDSGIKSLASRKVSNIAKHVSSTDKTVSSDSTLKVSEAAIEISYQYETDETDDLNKDSLPNSGCSKNSRVSDHLNSPSNSVSSLTDNQLTSEHSINKEKFDVVSVKSVVVSESESDSNSKPLIDISNPSNEEDPPKSASSLTNSTTPNKVKTPSLNLISDTLISSDEGLDDEVKRKLVTSVDLIVQSLKDESESESNNQCEKDSSLKSTFVSSEPRSSPSPVTLDTLPCTSTSDSLTTSATPVSHKLSVSKDTVQKYDSDILVNAEDNDSLSVISSHCKASDTIVSGSSKDINSVVVNTSSALSGSLSIVTVSVEKSELANVPGSSSAIVSPSQTVGSAKSYDSTKVSVNSSGSTDCTSSSCSRVSSTLNSDNYKSSCDCVEVAGVVSGRAVTITATSGPGPTSSTRVASPPSVSITAVVRSPATHLQPANLDPAHPAPHNHDGAPHSSLHHQLQPSNPHLHPHSHPHYQAVQQHPSQQPLSSASAATRMDHCDGSSDSGVSVTERSVSRSSVLSDDRSSSAEVKPNTPTPITASQIKTSQAAAALLLDRKENIRVYRDPSLLSQSEHSVRHIHSVQHTNMSQHYPGVPPLHHAPPPMGAPGSGGSHAPGHPSSHGQPPSSMPHGLPPNLSYPAAAAAAAAAAGVAPPIHLPPGLSQPMPPGLYPSLPHDVWKLGHVPAIPHNAYAGLLTPHPEELIHMERAREMDRERERAERDRML
ncbi:hypothetical protein SK128_027543, partial [Halocaridina rubra]